MADHETINPPRPSVRLNVTQAALSEGLSRQQVLSLIDRGVLSYTQLPGGRKMINMSELRALMERAHVPAKMAD